MHLLGPRCALLPLHRIMMSIVVVMSLSASLVAQATFSAAPPLLYQVGTIYVAPSSEDLAPLLKVRLENWTAVRITSSPDEADAILSCESQNTIVPAKVVPKVDHRGYHACRSRTRSPQGNGLGSIEG